MRVKRQKQIRRLLLFFQLNYGFKEPFKVLIDGNFLVLALKIKPNVDDLLSTLLNRRKVHSYTTKCIRSELRKMKTEFGRAFEVSKHMKLAEECDHQNNLECASCIDDIVKDGNEGHFFVATQDFKLRARLKSHAGIPIIYIDQGIPLIDMTYKVSVRETTIASEEKTIIRNSELEILKRKYATEEPSIIRRKHKSLTPNPLSMKRKRVIANARPKSEKRKRIRSKRPKKERDKEEEINHSKEDYSGSGALDESQGDSGDFGE